MILSIKACSWYGPREYRCDHCKKKNDEVRKMYYVDSTNPGVKTMVLCNCCMDLALNETGILPEEF